MESIFDKNLDTLSKSLDMYLLRHTVIADNIANAETPFFKARKVDFEKQLAAAVENSEATGGRSLASVEPVVFQDAESETGQDLNTVDMDREMAAMTKNDVKYSAVTQAVSRKFALLQYAITEGSGR